ncbi:MAG: type IV toxin-antitoxin system AbiEi family antitoxin domain-containing protein [Rectinema subterraneum]|uniref:type IV toxin-antitoxin system AbiEi family antitoxin domain-containing protein n=1 Tax=Rectinema subterraneum TaxID=2653714 RepID=UPI003C7C2515
MYRPRWIQTELLPILAEPRGSLISKHTTRAKYCGIFYLGTALSIHGISTWDPPEIQLAIRCDYRIAIPKSPPIRLFSFSRARFELGIIEKSTEAGIIRVYDREKTICDIIYFRNALGMDIAMQALREYLKDRSRDIPLLLEYVKLLRMEGSIRTYLEALS